jgi:carbonic anhydrase/acetyltransferase-like protein (isoleucine patch superfamily)
MNQSFIPNASFWQPVDTSQAAFIASNAVVIGNITIQEGANIWYGAVIRGDVEAIIIGKYSNVQDGAILHGDPGKPTIVGDYVTIGHRAVIHSAHIETGCLIGIGAVVLDGVRRKHRWCRKYCDKRCRKAIADGRSSRSQS